MNIVRKPMYVAGTKGTVDDYQNVGTVLEIGRFRFGLCWWKRNPPTFLYSAPTVFANGWQLRVWKFQVGIGITREN